MSYNHPHKPALTHDIKKRNKTNRQDGCAAHLLSLLWLLLHGDAVSVLLVSAQVVAEAAVGTVRAVASVLELVAHTSARSRAARIAASRVREAAVVTVLASTSLTELVARTSAATATESTTVRALSAAVAAATATEAAAYLALLVVTVREATLSTELAVTTLLERVARS